MRIVHVMTHLRLGAGRAIVDLCLEQRRRGLDVRVGVATDAEGAWASDPRLVSELRDAGVAVETIGDTFHRNPNALSEAVGPLRSLAAAWAGTTVAHAHTAMTGAVARWAGARHLAVTCHGWNLTRPVEYDLQDALALTMADAVVSPSADWARRLAALPGVPGVTVVPNGFDLSRYPSLPRRAGLKNGGPRIVCVGEITGRKGQDLLVQAMPRVWQAMPDTRLEFIGDGDMANRIRELAGKVDPTGQRIVLRGHLPHPYPELAEADAFCLPSRSDNQPVAIIEALLAGVPVVATDVGGIPELIDDTDAGVVVAAESPDALADGLLDILSRTSDSSRRERIEARARREYGVAMMATRIEAVYRACIAGPAGQPPVAPDATVANPLRPS